MWAHTVTSAARNRDVLCGLIPTVALRSIRVYRTVFTEAALFLSGLIPVDIVAVERAIVASWVRPVQSDPRAVAFIKSEERRRSLERRQTLWDSWTTGSWTRRLFPVVMEWYERRAWSGLSFHTTQALNGHGVFRTYLHRMGRTECTACLYCPCPVKVKHTVFRGQHWGYFRAGLAAVLGKDAMPENVRSMFCGRATVPPADWCRNATAEGARRVFISMVDAILARKEADERAVQRHWRERVMRERFPPPGAIP